MNNNQKSGLGAKIETALTWAAIIYLLLWALDWLLQRRWGWFVLMSWLWAMISWFAIAFALGTISDLTGDESLGPSDTVMVGSSVASIACGMIAAACIMRSPPPRRSSPSDGRKVDNR